MSHLRIEEEGVKNYIIIDPKERVARVYHLQNRKFIKVMDATDESCNFNLEKCEITFEFSSIWA